MLLIFLWLADVTSHNVFQVHHAVTKVKNFLLFYNQVAIHCVNVPQLFSMYTIMSSANSDSFTSSFPIWMHFISFPVWSLWLELPILCWIEVVKVDTLILGGKLLNLPVEYNVGCRFLICGLYYVEECSLCSHFDVCFYHKWVLYLIECCIYPEKLHLLLWSCDFCLSFCLCDVLCLLICEYCTIVTSEMNTTWPWCMIFLMNCWIQIANILLRILASVFIRDTDVSLPGLELW